jgi:hypothetical protein
MALFGSGATRIEMMRERIVGSSDPGSLDVRMMVVSAGGSSRSLRNALGVADDDHLPLRDARAVGGELHERAHRRDEDRVASAGRRVEPGIGDARTHRLGLVLEYRLRGGIRIGVARAREKPAEIGMHELRGVATVDALATGTLALARAKEELSEPEREPLLPDAQPSLDEEASGESRLRGALRQPATERFVTE